MTAPHRRRSANSVLRPSDVAWVAAAAFVMVVSIAATVGVAVACALFGRGWVWPHAVIDYARLLAGLVSGDPVHGLPAGRRAAAADPAAIYALVAITVLAAVAGLIVLLRAVLDLLGENGSRTGGFATRSQARQVLGSAALPRRRIREIRPDLHTGTSTEQTGEES